MEIGGFQGQRITAAHAEYDTARAVWNGAIDLSAMRAVRVDPDGGTAQVQGGAIR